MGPGSRNQHAYADFRPEERPDGRADRRSNPATEADLEVARSRLLAAGPAAVTDDELLALWLGLADARAAIGIRQNQAEGSAVALLQAPAAGLLAVPGLGRVRVARLLAAVALIERAAESGLRAMPGLSSSAAVRRFLRLKLACQRREVFACLFLDSRHRLIRFEPLFYGTVDRASVHPREVLRRALELNAAAVILAHNHPSGVAEPSASDLALTSDLTDLLRRIDVRVLDHLVVGRGTEVSFAERGLLG